MPLFRVEVTAEGVVYVPPLTEAELEGLTPAEIKAELFSRARECGECFVDDIVGEPSQDVSVCEQLTTVPDQYEGSLPWGDTNEKDRTCEEILAHEKEKPHG